ncbi:Peroxisomal acyl-coenzyme A oxidase 1 [Seminavis robusta]|uniref:Acyl-coenzyme A oxidase n=1 Tax=Seminavis robusta TaxID=568900 RepID=A0A9N8HQN7_9STRA|nr:Peroxisomal acyl-coenzyme A oxidase 1 [Seminavis robusta]|eukprot:Sro1308_g261490.1 Peroxisomal acyl-coenzyme A oxidase 1 (709) ;mRNA; r:18325-20566
MNADLQRERAQASFNTEKMTNLLDGGAAKTARRRQLVSIIEKDPTGIFSNDDNYYLHRTDRHVRGLAKAVRLIEVCRKLGIGDECDGHMVASEDWNVLLIALADDLPLYLHWVMFIPNIISLCDDEQQAEWLPLCRDWRMIGCYAQTEIGHGSNVRALETTATFLPESKGGMKGGSFVINSPTITSYKAWPGTLGRTANHAMVIARLIDGDGVDRGVHNFLVPLRSMETHDLLPGVETGDLGPKIGYNTMDNGFASFNNVVIPRRNMAMRFSQVDEQGKYIKKQMSEAASKIAYITMMQVRVLITDSAGKALGKASTIAIRYSAVRRQGFKDSEETAENQILDYRQQQHRLFPLLASSFCFFMTGKVLLKALTSIEHRVLSHQPVNRVEVTDIHASSSALKSYTSMVTADGIEESRKACGGHGFLQASGLPEMFTTYLQNPTVEGDNHMLPQQVIKVLLKLVQAVATQNNKALNDYKPCDSGQLIPSLQAIMGGRKVTCPAQSAEDLQSLSLLRQALCYRAARLLVGAGKLVQDRVEAGRTPEQAWNDALVEMARTSRAYAQFLLLHNFIKGIDEEEKTHAMVGAPEIAVLRDMARMCALYWIEKDLGDFLEDGYMSAQHAGWIRTNVLAALDAIRPNAVALVDSWDYSDFNLKSALGRWDGDVYPALLDYARRDPLNAKSIGPGYDPHLKRLIVDGVGAYTPTTSRL